jgi:hypothetical protein
MRSPQWITLALLFILLAGRGRSKSDDWTPLVAAPLTANSRAFPGTDGKWHIVYELVLTNANVTPATVKKIEVVDASSPFRILTSYEGSELGGRNFCRQDPCRKRDGAFEGYALKSPGKGWADGPETLDPCTFGSNRWLEPSELRRVRGLLDLYQLCSASLPFGQFGNHDRAKYAPNHGVIGALSIEPMAATAETPPFHQFQAFARRAGELAVIRGSSAPLRVY